MLTAGVMSHGGIEFKTKGRDDQAECEQIGPETFPGKVAGALQVDPFPLIKAYCKPRIKVGTEWVSGDINHLALCTSIPDHTHPGGDYYQII